MKRDMDLIRKFLLEIEEKCDGSGRVVNPPVEGYSSESVLYHQKLLYQAGYLDATPLGYGYVIRKLSWEGHDFLDSIRSESIWDGVKKHLAKVGGSTAIETIKRLAIKLAENELF